jgi:hypothetical protein
VLEDDGRTGYAYLYENERIVSDVWLYNAVPVARPAWDTPADLPFPNRPELMHDGELRLDEQSAIRCEWYDGGVRIFIDEVLTARLEPGATPGWSRLVKIDGPCGRRLADT